MNRSSPGNDNQILSLGSINADFQVRVKKRPEISETVVAGDFCRLSGGKAANVAFLAKKLGCTALLLGRVGDDDLSRQALDPIRAIGVDLSCVREAPGTPTGVAMISVPPDGKKGIVMAPNANHGWSEEDIACIVSAVRKAPPGSVLVADCEIDPGVLEQAMRTAKQRGLKVILDPSPAARADDKLLGLADVVVPNAIEAESITGIACKDAESAANAARNLCDRGAASACVKLSDGGCVLVSPEHSIRLLAAEVDVVDTTGAGDAFAGALAVAMMEQRPLTDAVRFAAAASHLAVSGYGSQPSYPDREQIIEMEKRLHVSPDAG